MGLQHLSDSELSEVSRLQGVDCCVPHADATGVGGGTVRPCLGLSVESPDVQLPSSASNS